MLEFCSLSPECYFLWASSSQLPNRPWLLLGAPAHILCFETSIALSINCSYNRKTVVNWNMKEKLGGYFISLRFLHIMDKNFAL